MPLRLTGVSRSVSDIVRVFFNITGGVKRSLEERLFERVSVKDFGAVGDGVNDDAPAIQAAIDYGATNGVEVYFPVPTAYYACMTRQSSAQSSVFYVDSTVRLTGPGEVRNFHDSHFFTFGTNAHNVVLDGMFINHNAQAIDDLSSSAVDALSIVTYPNKVYSGYGTEATLNIFARMYQYVGWPHGNTPDGTVRHCVHFRGDNCIIRNSRIRRSQGTAIRFSTGAKHGRALNNFIEEPRFNGINMSLDSEHCQAIGNYIYNTLQIGIAVFSSGTDPAHSHQAVGNYIINLKPLGENGIEYVGTSPTTIYGGVINDNAIEGFGSCGIRAFQCNEGTIVGNRVRKIRKMADQATRYPGSLDGTGIFLHNNALNWVVMGNSISEPDQYGVVINDANNRVFGNRINGTVTSSYQVAGVNQTGIDFLYTGGLGSYADDAAAATGGVPVNGLYHTSGTVKIRLT